MRALNRRSWVWGTWSAAEVSPLTSSSCCSGRGNGWPGSPSCGSDSGQSFHPQYGIIRKIVIFCLRRSSRPLFRPILTSSQEANNQHPGHQQPPAEGGLQLQPPSPGISPGLGQQRPGVGRPVHRPPGAAGLAASVLPGGPPAEGGRKQPRAAHPAVPVASGGTPPTPRLSDAKGRPCLAQAKPARERAAEAESEPEGGAGRRGTADLWRNSPHMVKHRDENRRSCRKTQNVAQQYGIFLFFFFFLHRDHFATCCSAFDQLGAVVAEMPSVEQLFAAPACVGGAENQPAITQSLKYVRGQVEGSIAEFTTWKTQLLSLGLPSTGDFTERRVVPSDIATRLPADTRANLARGQNQIYYFFFFPSPQMSSLPSAPSSLPSWRQPSTPCWSPSRRW